MKLSILILSHNRPTLFNRCINSVLKNKPDNVEIIVNNDTKDIEEVPGASYFYEKHDDLSDTYRFLFEQSNGEFIYYLEDDDYVVENFYKIIKMENSLYRYFPVGGYSEYKRLFTTDIKEYFQLSQLIFKKSDIVDFPKGNNIHNDFKLFNNITKYNTYNKIIFIQTIDGHDNISFNHNKDMRFK